MNNHSSSEDFFEPSEESGQPDLEHVDVQQPKRPPAVFTFWQGFSTVVMTAILVATVFTLWTPGSLVASSLEDRMATALETGAIEEDVLFESNLGDEGGPQWERIGIVSGHYGSDSGAVCPNGVTEAELNLKIATIVQKMLTDKNFEVDLLQEFDPRLWGYQAAVLVSIHLDSCEYINDLATGFKVATALATQDLPASQKLSRCLSEEYGAITGLPYHAGSVTPDMTYYHAFSEVDSRTPAAIIEAGFMYLDFQFITEETDRVAEGIVAGILCFLDQDISQANQAP